MELVSLDAKKRAAECIVFIRTQQVAKTQCLSIGRPIAVYVEEDDDIRNLLTSGVELNPSLLTRVRENHWKTIGQFHVANFPWCIFACDCVSASFQMSQIVETSTRHCQNSSFSSTQDILNILIGSLLEDQHSEDPVILRDEDLIDIGLLFRTRPQTYPHGTWIVPDCKEFHKPRSIGGSRLLTIIPGGSNMGPVLNAFGSEDQCLMCIEIQVPTKA